MHKIVHILGAIQEIQDMAGRPGYKARFEEEVKEHDATRQEMMRLRNIIIKVDPKLLGEIEPPRIKKFDALVVDRIMAMAGAGMTEEQWIGTFGLTMKTWVEWKTNHHELREAVDRANVKLLAWWNERARKAQEDGNNRFPIAVYERVTARIRTQMEAENRAVVGLGDASRLVLVDLRTDVDLLNRSTALDEDEDEAAA